MKMLKQEKRDLSNIIISTILGFCIGIVVMLVINPMTSYSKSINILKTEGIITIQEKTLTYQFKDSISQSELRALAKLNEVYIINLNVKSLNK